MTEKFLLSVIEKLRNELAELIGDRYNFEDPAVHEKSKKLDRALNLLEKLRAGKGRPK